MHVSLYRIYTICIATILIVLPNHFTNSGMRYEYDFIKEKIGFDTLHFTTYLGIA